MADDNTEVTGKKIFFIHPSVFVQNEIAAELVQQEHEVYIARDEAKLFKVLKNCPHSIVFASIDETLSADKWEVWIRQVMGDEVTKSVAMGVLSNTNNEDARRLYLNTLQVSCGFIPVKTEKTRVIKALLDILKAAEAKGRRKYIRADTRNDSMTTINLPFNNAYITGDIRDISVVGLSCVFPQDPELEKNSLLPDMQVKLQGALLKAEGIVFGSRMDGPDKVYVFVFTAKIDPSVRTKIRAYIQKNLQSKMDAELK
ncbi:hypothetical protein AGMMS50230_15440 [Spirochaetia bacterium]|nr:hypothetical protein AGMMS50230_15440 [Spirochaetia bacterium]